MTERVTRAIGTSPPRLEAGDKATGRARYADDVRLPGMLHAAIHTSPHAHARIVGYRLDAARAMPGVKAIVTGADLAGARAGGIIKDEIDGRARQGALRRRAGGGGRGGRRRNRRARGCGDRGRLRAAAGGASPSMRRSRRTRRSCTRSSRRYVKTVDGGGRGNVVFESAVERGRRRARVRRMRRRSSRARGRRRRSITSTWRPTAASPTSTRPGASRCTRPASRCITCSSASPRSSASRWRGSARSPRAWAAGSAASMRSNIHSIAAWLARAARRPVKLVLSRMQDFEIQRSRHPARIWMKTGARRDGTILARDVRITHRRRRVRRRKPAGAGVRAADVARSLPHSRTCARAGEAVYTNKLRAGSFRGFGNPQASFAGESQIDDLAARLGIDPVELRLRNAMRPDDTAFGGQPVRSCVLGECAHARARCAARAQPPLPPRAGRRRGVGFAAMSHVSGLMGTAATVQLRTDGSIALATGCVDIGQGADTVMVQICADALSRADRARQLRAAGQRHLAVQLEDGRQPLDVHDRPRGRGGDDRDAPQDARPRGAADGMRGVRPRAAPGRRGRARRACRRPCRSRRLRCIRCSARAGRSRRRTASSSTARASIRSARRSINSRSRTSASTRSARTASRWTSITAPARSRCAARGARTTSGARSIRSAAKARSRAASCREWATR